MEALGAEKLDIKVAAVCVYHSLVPAAVEAISNGDFYRANWQALTPGQPEDIYYAGLNLVGLAPIPDGSYSVLASVVCGATNAVDAPAVKNGFWVRVTRPTSSRASSPDVVMPITPSTAAVLRTSMDRPNPSVIMTVVVGAGTGPE